MGIAKELGMRYNNLSLQSRAELIEYWVEHPSTTMKQLGELFDTNEWTAARILTRDYLPVKDGYTVIRQSKINEPELITID